MHKGRDIVELAQELKRQRETAKDFIADTRKLEMIAPVPNDEKGSEAVVLAGLNGGSMAINDLAHDQIADTQGIPRPYYRKMLLDQPDLLATNVNTWFQRTPSARMVRTLDSRVRAVVSKRFRTLDNFDLAETVLPILADGGAQVVSAELTERRFYVKAIFPHLSEGVPAGVVLGEGHDRIDAIIAAIVWSNSEVGAGRLKCEAGLYNTWCTNLMISPTASMKKFHIGRALDVEEEVREILSDEAKEADDRAIWLKVRDVARASADEDFFRSQIALLKGAAGREIEGDVPRVVEVTAKKYTLSKAVSKGVLDHLIRGGSLTQWGLANAITRTAADVGDYDLATQLERIGGKVVELKPTDWKAISTAQAVPVDVETEVQ